MKENARLIRKAKEALHYRKLSDVCEAGEVSAAILTTRGNIYVGINIDAACGIGFCAEHGAVAQMVTRGESRIRKVVAVSADGHFLPPCGRCRELMYQVDRRNIAAEVILGEESSTTLEALLPQRWQDTW